MWAEAAKAIAKYSEGVLTALDANGYPISVRQTSLAYDADSGELPVVLPDALQPVAGPANLLCHFHDDGMWNLRAITVKGRIERRGERWLFVSTRYTPPLSPIALLRGASRSARKYLDKRGLPWPQVDFDAVERLWQKAKQIENP